MFTISTQPTILSAVDTSGIISRMGFKVLKKDMFGYRYRERNTIQFVGYIIVQKKLRHEQKRRPSTLMIDTNSTLLNSRLITFPVLKYCIGVSKALVILFIATSLFIIICVLVVINCFVRQI